jgi:hypothetical protein
MRQADLYSEYNENTVRNQGNVTIPNKAFNDISNALIETNDFMEEMLSDNKMLGSLEGLIPGPPPDHGDYAQNYNFYNTGDWFKNH